MKLIKVDIQGFKLYKESQSFSFGMANHIIGGHGEGKTTLGEAIIWCLKGCDTKGSVKGVKKRLMNPACKEMKVGCEFEICSATGEMETRYLFRVSTARSSSCILDGTKVS
ncbi:AAA family ATPase (plasmid) [Paenibacillus sonchi]|uniref:AAA family ATPase n=1 Tax=Paenibacillus sonchi TaxID=373687 RepID=A0A974PJ94_9BACL|nr:AAA family ATPase [Paenibacillus sonchi]QQZ64613.1 AAA family ATPase [Paenibacillus sonchi]